MNKKKIITRIGIIFSVIMIAVSATVILAAPSINLTSSQSGNTVNLSWTNSDTYKAYGYNVYRSTNDGAYEDISNAENSKVKVLNIYPSSGQNISFTTYSGQYITTDKAASLKQWMEQPNGNSSKGYGRGVIDVTPVSVGAFNGNPSGYLKKVNGKYNYDVVVIGTWDTNLNQDTNDNATNVLRQYLAEGNSFVMGHDTINGANINPNINSLRGYFNIKVTTHDGVTPTSSASFGNSTVGQTTQVRINGNSIFTTYPWNIGVDGTVLTVPACHTTGQVTYGSVPLSFVSGTPHVTDQNGQGEFNYYLTISNHTAMIQTGHSNCNATADEQKIWANLLFYLGNTDANKNATDPNAKDINVPNKPVFGNNTLNYINGTVTFSATDNGTTYKYYVRAEDLATDEITSSNTVTQTNTSGVAGYSYVIDTNSNTTVDNTIDTTSTSINYTLGDGPNTYLHIKAIDGAGNVGETLHVLLHENIAPELSLSQDITRWTNGNVIISATSSDSDGRVVSVKLPDNTVVTGDNATYEVERNGTYEFSVTDNSGATTTKSITITNIDKVKPQGTSSVEQPTPEVRGATITLNATDDASGVAKIVKPDGTEVTNATTTYVVTIPGTYTFKVVDVAGNENDIEVPVVIVSDGVDVRYIDQVTGEEIAATTKLKGNVGQSYQTVAKQIDGYELVLTPSNYYGMFTIDKITVTYEYRKTSYVTTRYVNENNGYVLSAQDTRKYKEGDAYSTIKQNIEGYTFTRVEGNVTGTVERSDITVTYYYKKNTSVTVNYIDMITNNVIATQEVMPGLQNDDYTTVKKDIDGYVFVEVSGATTGKMQYGSTEVTYKYKKLSNLVTEHIDANTNQKITDDIVRAYKEGEQYEAYAQNLEGYILIQSPNPTTGVMGRENVTKSFYYKRISGGLVVKYVDIISGEMIDQEIYTGNENDTVSLDEKTFLGYVLEQRPDYEDVILGVEAKEVVFYYRKAIAIDVIGINQETGEQIYITEVSGLEEGTYETIPREVDGYEVVKIPDNKNGIFYRDSLPVIYEYKMISGKVTVLYVDKESNILLDRCEIKGELGKSYTTEQKSFDNYNFVEVVGETAGTLTTEPKDVIYYYEKKVGKVVVTYEDENGKEVLKEEKNGKVGDEYTVTVKDIPGYEIVEVPENVEGTYKDGVIEVKIKVQKIREGKILVKYIDRETNKVLDSYIIDGRTGENYKTDKKSFANYKLVKVVGNEIGTLPEGQQEVIYYYERNTSKVIVIYEDTEGNEVLRQEITGKVGDKYSVTIKDIPGYEIVEKPDNTTGTYTDDSIVIKVIVEKSQVKPIEQGTIVVKYVDDEGNIIKEDYIEEGEVGKNFYMELPEIDGYELLVQKVIKSKFTNGEQVFEAKYRKLSENIFDLPNTGDINITLYIILFIIFGGIILRKLKLEK